MRPQTDRQDSGKARKQRGAFPPTSASFLAFCEVKNLCACACLPVSSEVGQGDLVSCQISIDENFLVSFSSMLSFYRVTEIYFREEQNSNKEDISLFFSQGTFSPELRGSETRCKNTHDVACLISHAALHTSSICIKVN